MKEHQGKNHILKHPNSRFKKKKFESVSVNEIPSINLEQEPSKNPNFKIQPNYKVNETSNREIPISPQQLRIQIKQKKNCNENSTYPIFWRQHKTPIPQIKKKKLCHNYI